MAAAAPAEVAHHDATRAQVTATAIFVCALRARESEKPEGERLIFDPLASMLCGGESPDLSWTSQTGMPAEFWVDFLAVRTRWIDDALAEFIPEQLAIPGAGLDCRAYRLEALRGVPVYEVDFPEVLDAKLALLEGEGPLAEQHIVRANLGLDGWVQELTAAGFQAGRASTWLLEGLTGYLTQEELTELFRRVGALAAPGSRMIITFVGEAMRKQATDMHKFFVSNKGHAEEFLRSHGWSCQSSMSVSDMAALYGRTANLPDEYPYYGFAAVREHDQPSASAAKPGIASSL